MKLIRTIPRDVYVRCLDTGIEHSLTDRMVGKSEFFSAFLKELWLLQWSTCFYVAFGAEMNCLRLEDNNRP